MPLKATSWTECMCSSTLPFIAWWFTLTTQLLSLSFIGCGFIPLMILPAEVKAFFMNWYWHTLPYLNVNCKKLSTPGASYHGMFKISVFSTWILKKHQQWYSLSQCTWRQPKTICACKISQLNLFCGSIGFSNITWYMMSYLLPYRLHKILQGMPQARQSNSPCGPQTILCLHLGRLP